MQNTKQSDNRNVRTCSDVTEAKSLNHEDTACTRHHWLERINKLHCPLDMTMGAEEHLNDCTKIKFLTAVLGIWLTSLSVTYLGLG